MLMALMLMALMVLPAFVVEGIATMAALMLLSRDTSRERTRVRPKNAVLGAIVEQWNALVPVPQLLIIWKREP
jgi:hypothetical protein